MKQFNYAYDLGTSGRTSQSITFDEPVTDKEFTSRGGESGTILREDMVISVEVEWDDQEETFELVQ